jgi:hypothetical protein
MILIIYGRKDFMGRILFFVIFLEMLLLVGNFIIHKTILLLFNVGFGVFIWLFLSFFLFFF